MKTFIQASIVLALSLQGCGDSPSTANRKSPEEIQNEAIADTAAFIKEQESTATSRSFVFHYNFRMHGLKPGAELRVWLPMPTTDSWQTVTCGDVVADSPPRETVETKYGNRIQYFGYAVPNSGESSLRIPYTVRRKEVHLKSLDSNESISTDLFLAANSKVPIDGKASALLDGVALPRDPLKRARAIYDLVDDRVRYSKDGDGWGQGDAEWVCDSRFGNCTDFHSLFISLARSKGISARFEIGFPVAADSDSGPVAGYHCWGWFHIDGKGWVPVDISEADKHPELKEYYFGNVTADRVAFSTGRDLLLEPPQNGPPLNYFVYPYAEVDGEIVSRDHLELQFEFATVE